MDEQALQSECKPKAITECSIKFRWTKSQERKYLTTWFFFFLKREMFRSELQPAMKIVVMNLYMTKRITLKYVKQGS